MKLSTKFHYARQNYRRRMRLLFPSPAELRFIRLMGGHALTVPFIRIPPHGFRLAVLIVLGRKLRREYCQRERRIGPYMADFAFESDYDKRIIEIDGYAFHRQSKKDIVYEQNRDDYLRRRGWYIKRIPATRLWRDPARVRREVIKYLS